MRCNRENPCSNCLRSRSETCIYENQKHTPTLDNQVLLQNRANGRILIPRTHRTPYSDLTSSVSESTQTRPTHTSKSPTSVASSMSTPGSRQSVTDAELAKPKHRVRQFEDQMANLAPSQAQPPPLPFDANMISTSTHLGGTMHINYDSSAPGQSQAIARSVVQKNRLLGQSHWCVNNILLVSHIITRRTPIIRTNNRLAPRPLPYNGAKATERKLKCNKHTRAMQITGQSDQSETGAFLALPAEPGPADKGSSRHFTRQLSTDK